MIANRKVDHINLVVKNIDEAVKWYHDMMGYEVIGDFMSHDGRRFMYIGNDQITYELFEDASLDKPSIEHVAYVSDDIEADFAFFKNQGLETTPSKPGFIDFTFGKGVYYFFVKGVNGDEVEFCQIIN